MAGAVKRFYPLCIRFCWYTYLLTQQPFVEAWFENWFGTRYYHLLYRHRDAGEAETFIRRILEMYPPPPSARVVDAACGKGRHSQFLARMGYWVDGFDLSVHNIQDAAREAPVKARFFVHDLRVPFADNYYDLLLNLFTSFGYFSCWEDNIKALVNFDETLKPGGYALIDFMNVTRVKQTLVPYEVLERNGVRFTVERVYQPPYIKKFIAAEEHGQVHHFREQVQALELEDFEQMLSHTAFGLAGLHGDYKMRPFERQHSPRLILVLRKRLSDDPLG